MAKHALMTLVVLGVALTACGGASASGDTFYCQNSTAFQCNAINTTGVWTTRTCVGAFSSVTSCPTTGLVGRCVVHGSIAGAVTCPDGTTCTLTAVYSTGADVTASQASCAGVNGVWSTP